MCFVIVVAYMMTKCMTGACVVVCTFMDIYTLSTCTLSLHNFTSKQQAKQSRRREVSDTYVHQKSSYQIDGDSYELLSRCVDGDM